MAFEVLKDFGHASTYVLLATLVLQAAQVLRHVCIYLFFIQTMVIVFFIFPCAPIYIIIAKYLCRLGNIPTSYSEGFGFESRHGYRLTWLRIFMVSPITYGIMPQMWIPLNSIICLHIVQNSTSSQTRKRDIRLRKRLIWEAIPNFNDNASFWFYLRAEIWS
jgi:hypothetical protein